MAQARNFVKKRLWTQVFSSEFCEILKNTFFIEHIRWLLLVKVISTHFIHTLLPCSFMTKTFFLLEGHIFPTEVNPVVSITKYFSKDLQLQGSWQDQYPESPSKSKKQFKIEPNLLRKISLLKICWRTCITFFQENTQLAKCRTNSWLRIGNIEA